MALENLKVMLLSHCPKYCKIARYVDKHTDYNNFSRDQIDYLINNGVDERYKKKACDEFTDRIHNWEGVYNG